ncbi:MAG: protease modulator HflC [Prosthecobacter sp.]|uniref:protease modulator HflC n=1 Tax=Prosthecobacter sp. TaxID=1965333 RepID=UPI00260FC255|nr:protease modulator HflC [Prosthecobacter sp.]MCF7789602.1 protease modulator HflC [Prosthecobacter sp.]
MKSSILLIVVLALVFVASSGLYTVSETEQVVITQFGKPVGESIRDAGLHWKTPFVQTINRLDKRVLEWDGPSANMTTKDKVIVVVDAFGRWEINDPLVFFRQLTDERRALSRLDDILASETRIVIAKHEFIEAVRTTKDRKAVRDESNVTPTGSLPSTADTRLGVLPPITYGRVELEAEILKNAIPKIEGYGIRLLDVRFKRIDYDPTVSKSIHQRMISEREQIAKLHRAEGEGEAAKINGERERDLATIESEAYRKVQEMEGTADAKATEIYAKAYNQTPEAAELFDFLKTMETYKQLITSDTTMIFTTDSELFRYLKSSNPQATKPVTGAASNEFTPLDKLPNLLDVRR